jgi:hypothetical protein
VPREELWVEPSDALVKALGLDGAFEDPPDRDGVHRRLDKATRRKRPWCELARLGRCPELGSRGVIRNARIEHDVRQPAVAPLRTEEMLDLAKCPVRVVTAEADRDECRIPAPLMRIQARSRLRPAPDVVPG